MPTTTPSTTPVGTSCLVTNAIVLPSPALSPQTSRDGSLVCINAYNHPDTDILGFYQQTLQPLAFAGGNTLAVSKTDTITLDQTRNGQPVTQYDLIFAQTDNLFPVQNLGEMLDLTTQTYPPITLPAPPARAPHPAPPTRIALPSTPGCFAKTSAPTRPAQWPGNLSQWAQASCKRPSRQVTSTLR